MSAVNCTGQDAPVISISDLTESERLAIELYRSSEPFRVPIKSQTH